jgi:hypothetical protein
MLREGLSTSTEFRAIVSSIRGVVFLATPHTGSDIASLITYLGVLMRTTVATDELQAHAPALRDLNRWFRNNFSTIGVKVKVFFETQPLKGLMVVNASSADPGIANVTPIPVEANHVSICKPSKSTDPVFATTLRFINEVLPPTTLAADPLGAIQRNLLLAKGVRDLEAQDAELKVFLMTHPPTPEALILQSRIQRALAEASKSASPRQARSKWLPNEWLQYSFLPGWLILFVALGFLWHFTPVGEWVTGAFTKIMHQLF